ncbi:FxsB family cyclophane-forming radical SAM/SPASM peptide maturase [Streptomyces chartreusis]|uniref:FxsB family cyclophane-forming radical SAM/SPASM peptide maturase n=1 Tax=Streptomyces chartreusis TaxID=1969 RepID=UPI003D8E82A0
MFGSCVPLRQLVLKVHSRCDLACDHCYVYEHADQSWSSRPKQISAETISWTALRLAEHAKTHQLASVQVILHGGEPLLAGPHRLRAICEELATALRGVCDLDLRIHTNAVRLNPRHLDVFAEFDVRVGISLDGDRAANDRHRVFVDGRSSYDQVLDAIALLNEARYRRLYAGILCTIDVRNDPIAVYDALAELRPPRIDFLLPHSTWNSPPPRPSHTTATPYADWLLAVHDRWSAQGHPMPVRIFDSILSTLSGGPSLTEAMGLESADVVVVETDGTYEQADSLKTAYEGGPVTGMDVFRHTLDEVASHPGLRARQLGLAGLCDSCRACPVVRSCGGGLFAHRYRDETGFDNPSVFCADLMQLIHSIDARTGASGNRAIQGFDALADGTDDGTAARILTEARRGVTQVLLSDLGEELRNRTDRLWDASWELFEELWTRDRDLLEPLLSHPYTRTWVMRGLDRTASPDHLASLVAAASLASGARVEVPVRNGFVHLPGAGRLGVPAVEGTVTVTMDDLRGPHWEPLRRVRDQGLDVALDDLDPHRDCFGAPVLSRLDDEETERWRLGILGSWELIRKALPAVADSMEAGVRVITPLAAPADSRLTPGGGFGALGVGFSHDPVRLAVDLVHGFRIGILDALLDVCDLYEEADVHTGALLSDTYARAATDALRPKPVDSRRTREQWEELSAAASLTALGQRFVAGIGHSL